MPPTKQDPKGAGTEALGRSVANARSSPPMAAVDQEPAPPQTGGGTKAAEPSGKGLERRAGIKNRAARA